MHVFTQRPRPAQQTSATISTLGRPHSGQGREASIFAPQRTAENQAVQPMLRTDPARSEAELAGTAARRFGRDFSGIRLHASAKAMQTKLTINKPGDIYEEEADRVSEQIMRMPQPSVQRKYACGGTPSATGEREACGNKPASLQRMSLDDAGPVASDGAPHLVHDVLRSPAQSLEPAMRAFMEARTGYDFGRVQVHTDTRANASASAVAARAYTVGRHIVFGAGQFAPSTAEGRRLIAHELVHVMQQGGAAAGLPATLTVGPPGDAFEREADRLADTIAGGTPDVRATAPPIAAVSPPLNAGFALQRQQCDPTKDTIKTGPLPTTLPTLECAPTPQTLQDVRATPGASPTILGVTESGASSDQLHFEELKGSRCTAQLLHAAEPLVNYSKYVKVGDFNDGTEQTPTTPANRPCAGKVVRKVMRITAAAAAKLRQGEAEHCEDAKLAFALSWGKFNQASKDLEGEYCAAGIHVSGNESICDKEFAKRFTARTGVDWADREQVANCLLDKSKLRDTNHWHDVTPVDRVYAKDCSTVTDIYGAGSAPEVGRHPPSEIVKGCGEK